jgi:hypothetical protein
VFPIADEREVEVPQIVKNSSTSGNPAYNRNVIFFNKIEIDFGQGVLVFAGNDAGPIAPKHENVVRKGLQDIFLGCQVKVGIGLLTLNTKHR